MDFIEPCDDKCSWCVILEEERLAKEQGRGYFFQKWMLLHS
jgi:hypothetical protein